MSEYTDRKVRRYFNKTGDYGLDMFQTGQTVDVARPVTDMAIHSQLDEMRTQVAEVMDLYRFPADSVKPIRSGLARVSLIPQPSTELTHLYPRLPFDKLRNLLHRAVDDMNVPSELPELKGSRIELSQFDNTNRSAPTLLSIYFADEQLAAEKQAIQDVLDPWYAGNQEEIALTPRLKLCRLPEINGWVAGDIEDRLQDQLASFTVNLGALAVSTRMFPLDPVSRAE